MYSWTAIESSLATLVPTTGGYSSAKRGIVTLSDGVRAFVKVGVTESTKLAAKREVAVYEALAQLGYPYIPKLLAVADTHEAFALDVVEATAGWNWDNDWSSERLTDTLRAIDALADLSSDAHTYPIFNRVEDMMQVENGWQFFKDNDTKQKKLQQLAMESSYSNLVFDFDAEFKTAAAFEVKQDTLTHFDLRADNAAWHKDNCAVKIIDWNWTCLGDRDIDMAAFLTHVACFNKEIVLAEKDRLSVPALRYLAGFWLHYATEPLWEGGPAGLRSMQLASGLMAYELFVTVDSL